MIIIKNNVQKKRDDLKKNNENKIGRWSDIRALARFGNSKKKND